MPDKRGHRGPHPKDRTLFSPEHLETLRSAVADLSWLFTRQYAQTSSLKLVGDRYKLTERQRLAVLRSSCSEQSLQIRRARLLPKDQLARQPVAVDGYNLLTTIEAALAKGALFIGRDGCLRDLASIHGTFRRVQETVPALDLIAQWSREQATGPWHWYLDQPVSNSGRLRSLMADFAKDAGCNWEIELVFSPDAVLKKSTAVVVTADSQILDQASRWANVARDIVESKVSDAWIIDLS